PWGRWWRSSPAKIWSACTRTISSTSAARPTRSPEQVGRVCPARRTRLKRRRLAVDRPPVAHSPTTASAPIDMRIPSPKINLGRRGGGEGVGLDIQPGLVAAVQARVNGAVLAERAGTLPLGPDTVREGEVADQEALTDAVRE